MVREELRPLVAWGKEGGDLNSGVVGLTADQTWKQSKTPFHSYFESEYFIYNLVLHII
jgi:hypothetical protein